MNTLRKIGKVVSIVVFFLAVITLICNIAFGVYGVIGVCREYEIITKTPGTSELDYLGLGWGYAYFSFFISFFGLIISVLAYVTTKIQVIKNLSVGTIIFFSGLLVAAFMFPGVMFNL